MEWRVYVLLTLFSLASSQCGNNCNCGDSACCQKAFSSGSLYTIFNFGPGHNLQNRYGHRQNSNKVSCLKTKPIPFPLHQVYQDQPVYTRIVEDTNYNRQIDNICLTFFPLPDDSNTFLVYTSTVYCDGSNSLSTTIDTNCDIGTIQRGNPFATTRNRIFASLGDNLFVGCKREDYGDDDSPEVFAISLGSVSPLGGGCVQQIQNIIQCVGQDEGGLYVLPYRLPTRCVTQQVCSLTNPLLYPTSYYPYARRVALCDGRVC